MISTAPIGLSANSQQSEPPLSSIQHPVLRERYSSFNAYIQERIKQNSPIDVIAGRGIDCSSLKLKTNRLKNGEEVSYSPFMIDIDPKQNPDLLLDVRNIHFAVPSSSVDELYLERIFPLIYLDLRVYQAAAKVLKVGGELIIDYNDRVWDESLRKEQALIIKNALLTLKIPFELTFIDRNNHEWQRNDEQSFSALRCVKVSDFDHEQKEDLFQRAQSALDRWNYDIEKENSDLQKALRFSSVSPIGSWPVLPRSTCL